jgi:hypothetical protein
MAPVAHITRACSRRSRLSRRLLTQASRQPSSLLKLGVMLTLNRLSSASQAPMTNIDTYCHSS